MSLVDGGHALARWRGHCVANVCSAAADGSVHACPIAHDGANTAALLQLPGPAAASWVAAISGDVLSLAALHRSSVSSTLVRTPQGGPRRLCVVTVEGVQHLLVLWSTADGAQQRTGLALFTLDGAFAMRDRWLGVLLIPAAGREVDSQSSSVKRSHEVLRAVAPWGAGRVCVGLGASVGRGVVASCARAHVVRADVQGLAPSEVSGRVLVLALKPAGDAAAADGGHPIQLAVVRGQRACITCLPPHSAITAGGVCEHGPRRPRASAPSRRFCRRRVGPRSSDRSACGARVSCRTPPQYCTEWLLSGRRCEQSGLGDTGREGHTECEPRGGELERSRRLEQQERHHDRGDRCPRRRACARALVGCPSLLGCRPFICTLQESTCSWRRASPAPWRRTSRRWAT
jgi:hypothetical protein